MRTKQLDQVFEITSARRALTEDVHDRNVRYLVAMSIRTAAFLLAMLAPSPWRWILAAAAVLLPWLSVVMANAGRELPAPPKDVIVQPQTLELHSGEYLR